MEEKKYYKKNNQQTDPECISQLLLTPSKCYLLSRYSYLACQFYLAYYSSRVTIPMHKPGWSMYLFFYKKRCSIITQRRAWPNYVNCEQDISQIQAGHNKRRYVQLKDALLLLKNKHCPNYVNSAQGISQTQAGHNRLRYVSWGCQLYEF